MVGARLGSMKGFFSVMKRFVVVVVGGGGFCQKELLTRPCNRAPVEISSQVMEGCSLNIDGPGSDPMVVTAASHLRVAEFESH